MIYPKGVNIKTCKEFVQLNDETIQFTSLKSGGDSDEEMILVDMQY